MENRRRNSASTSYSNTAYKEDDDVAENETVDNDDLALVPESPDLERPRSHSLPANNTTATTDPHSMAQLEGIPEETPSIVRIALEDMSISNFKAIQGGYYKTSCQGKVNSRPDRSSDSAIQMRAVVTEPQIHTGRKFRKMSKFVIAPHPSSSSYSDHLTYESGDERFSIKRVNSTHVPELFIEFDSLHFNRTNQRYYWTERYRWLRYEEYYNPQLRRFDEPHLSPLSVRGISSFRKLFAKGEVVLDCHETRYEDLLKNIYDLIAKAGTFSTAEIKDIQNSLVQRHFHAGELMTTSNSSKAIYNFNNRTQSFEKDPDAPRSRKPSVSSFNRFDKGLSQMKLDARLESGTEALSVQVGALDSLEHTFILFIRLEQPIKAEGLNEVNCPLRFIFVAFGPKSQEEELMEVGRVFAVMMSTQEFREVGYSANDKEELLEAMEVLVDCSILVPISKVITKETVAAMLPQMKQYATYIQTQQNQKLFDEIRQDIVNSHQDLTAVHTTSGARRSMPVNMQKLGQARLSSANELLAASGAMVKRKRVGARHLITQFCPPLYHFLMDWKGLATRYASDYADALRRENLSMVIIGVVFIYFVVLSPAITFGALLNAVNAKMTVSLMLVASGFYQFLYALLSGQPLEVVGITGPVFVVEKVLGSLAKNFQIDLEAMRFWIGIYVAILGLVFTMFNGVIIIKHFRRSVEEVYNFLVAAIFILSAFFSMFKALPYSMTTISPNATNADVVVKERWKFGVGGTTLFLAFFMANFCIILVTIKRGSFFRRQIRNLLGSFNVPLGIILIVALERIFFFAYGLPTLNVPPSNIVNLSLWVNPPVFGDLAKLSAEAHGFCFLISLSLFAILITEISTNSIATTKTERKLVKPSLYSLNYFYILVIFPIISAVTGWPFVSGAMVRSNAHCLAMSRWSLNLPGVPSKVTGAVEQRVSGVVVGLLVFLSVFLGSALQHIPMAAMYGMFLYMGIMGARDLVFTRRLISILKRRKYWAPDEFLKDYPTWNIGILVLIQALFIGILISLNCISEFTSYSWVNLIFPVFVGLYATLRGYVLPKWPRFNSHLSKMDKKHPVKLYADVHAVEQVLLTVDDSGVNMEVIGSESLRSMAVSDDDGSAGDTDSEMDKYW